MKTAVLLVNLGSPNSSSFWDMRRYLKQFLTDKRVIEWPRFLWYPILFGIVLTLRPWRSGKNYQRIWHKESNLSPLLYYSFQQASKLQECFKEQEVLVACAMRYGAPSLEKAVKELMEKGVQRILLFPLYPQYASSTTGYVCEAFLREIAQYRTIPALRTVPSFPAHGAYIDAIAQSIRDHLAQLNNTPEKIIVSFHGLPQSYIEKGEIYRRECEETFAALKKNLNFEEGRLILAFQSRFGPEEWLQPYISQCLQQLGQEGVKSVSVIAPGFIADCVETLDEIARELKEDFERAGGEFFSYIPCLNDSKMAIKMLETLTKEELSGWYSQSAPIDK